MTTSKSELEFHEANNGPQLHVVFLNGSQRWYPTTHGWKVDEAERTLKIGVGLGRKVLPLENIEYFSPV